MPHPITPNEMEAAIDGRGAQVNQADLADLLEAVQEEIEDLWSNHMAALENGDLELIAERDDSLIFADHTGEAWQALFDVIVNFVNLLGVEEEKMPETIMAAHHNAAYRLVDFNWSTANPMVVGKPADFDDAQQFVEAEVNSLIGRGLSPGQAWAYYGVEIRGNSRNKWAKRCGYSDHSVVSGAVRKAKEKLAN